LIGALISKSSSSFEVQNLVPAMVSFNKNGNQVNFFQPYYNHSSERYYRARNSVAELPEVKIINTSDGYYILTYYEFIGGDFKSKLMKVDVSGNLKWEKMYSGLGNLILNDAQILEDGNLLMYGYSTTSIPDYSFPEGFNYTKNALMKVDQDGNELWSKYSGSAQNTELLKQVSILPNGTILATGITALATDGYHKIFTVQFNSDGDIIK
jgi:hypothetical protein